MQRNDEHATVDNDSPVKRQRRPSVRLNQPYYVNPTRGNLQKKWDAFKKDLEGAKKAKSRRNAAVEESDDFDDDLAIGNWKSFNVKDLKRKRGKNEEKEESLNSNGSGSESEKEVETGEEEPEDMEKSDGLRNEKLSHGGEKQGRRQMVVANGGGIRGVGGERETYEAKGVKMWLKELGLGKYESSFEVHEVDEDVLPLLTLEDLKDMGINAVGSRRKLYYSIQKLSKGFV